MARKIISELSQTKKPIFVVGGTGLYIRALLRGIINTPPVDEKIRNYYRGLANTYGRAYLFDMLKQKDAVAAERIKQNDLIRVIRALEVLEQTGESITSKQAKHVFADCPYNILKIGLRIERQEIKERIVQRTDKMLALGLVDEVKSLLRRGYSEKIKPLQSLGYRQIIRYLAGEYDLIETQRLINRDTWHYAKRQMTWFAADKTIQWFAPGFYRDIKEKVNVFLQQNNSV